MSVGVLERPATGSAPAPSTGGVAARRAMVRWAWRLFRREWRQQLLILLLIIVAVAAVVVGAAVAVNTPPPANAGFGTAHDLATFNLSAPTSKAPGVTLPHVQAQIAMLEQRFGRVQVIENETFSVPGSTQTYQLRSQDPHGPYGGPMLQLLSGRYPTGADQVAITPGLASELNLSVGDTWPQGGKTVVGIVQNPQSLLDEFALVPPGQVAHPTQVTVLFDASRVGSQGSARPTSPRPGRPAANGINPSTIVLALATVGMLLIALVSIGGFTVLAQRRMRSLGMLESMGATDRNVRLVLEANGVIVGVVGAVVGFASRAWCSGWRTARTTSRARTTSSRTFALPWNVIVPAMVLAVIATFFAAGYPARAITRVPVVSALAGRPAPPRQIHRSLVPGVIALVLGFVMFSLSGAAGNGGGVIWLVPGLIALIVGDHPRLTVLPRPAGPGGRPVAHRHPPAATRHGALPGPLRLGALGHQPRHHDRGHHLRRRRRPLLQRLRLRRPEHGGEHAQRVQPAGRPGPSLQSGTERAQTQTAPAPPSVSAQEASVARHRLRGRRDGRRRARQPGRGPAEPERQRPAVGRPDLRGDARPAAGLRHQPLVHPVQRRHPRARGPGWPARACSSPSAAAGKGGGGFQGLGAGGNDDEPVHAQPVPRPPRGPGGEPAAHRHLVAEHGDHRERAAPAARREPEQPRTAGRSWPAPRSRRPSC